MNIIQKNGFEKTLSFVERQRENAYLSGFTLILSIDPSTLDERELRLLEKEARELLLQRESFLPEDLTDIMKFIYRRNILGMKPTHTQVGQELDISKPTTRKRLRTLVSAGFVKQDVKGRTKVVELTEKGRNLFSR